MAASVLRAAVADGVFTFLWIFCVSTLGTLTSLISSALGVQSSIPANLTITVSLVVVLLSTFEAIARLVGGASFNPTGTAAFYAAGLGNDTLLSLAFRFPAQAAGAVAGVLSIVKVMPPQYKHMLRGPSLKVDPHTGAIAEGVLTFIISFAVLWIIVKGPRNPLVKTSMLAISTVTLVVSGSAYTGPSMNPANAFGWAYLNNRHNTWEQFYVYWICPFIGAILAALAFRLLFAPPVKVKKA